MFNRCTLQTAQEPCEFFHLSVAVDAPILNGSRGNCEDGAQAFAACAPCVMLQMCFSSVDRGKTLQTKSRSPCLVEPAGADHSLPAYKLKMIALSMLYYLPCC